MPSMKCCATPVRPAKLSRPAILLFALCPSFRPCARQQRCFSGNYGWLPIQSGADTGAGERSEGRNRLWARSERFYGVNFIDPMYRTAQVMRKNVSSSVASMTGGEYQLFTTRNKFEAGMTEFTNHLRSRYLLISRRRIRIPGCTRWASDGKSLIKPQCWREAVAGPRTRSSRLRLACSLALRRFAATGVKHLTNLR
jgi:hypothetical protein